MEIRAAIKAKVTLLARPQITLDGADRMFKFYQDGGADEARDRFPRHAELIEFAGRVCYHANGRKRPETATAEGYIANLMSQRHWSPTEHGTYTFFVEDVSRALTHELVRHRHGSYSQESQRYVKALKDPAIVVPPNIQGLLVGGEFLTPEEFAQNFEPQFESYDRVYNDLRQEGFDHKQASEAARAALPNAFATDIVFSMNARSLVEFIEKRDADGADAEIRALAQQVAAIMAEELPQIFSPEARKLWSGEHEQKGIQK